MSKSLISLAVTAIVLSGCSLIPDYMQPAAPVAAQYPQGPAYSPAHTDHRRPVQPGQPPRPSPVTPRPDHHQLVIMAWVVLEPHQPHDHDCWAGALGGTGTAPAAPASGVPG